jgi:hypothetical protein
LSKQSFSAFRERYMNRKVDVGTKDKPKQKNLGDWWLDQELRRQFDRVTFSPGRETPDAYNLWRGFACESVPGDCSLFLDHLRQNVCGGREEQYDYLIKWMARAVQTPDTPGFSAIVMRGGQGTGKSIVAKTFGSLFGRHYMQVTDPKHLVGSFNAHLRDCVVLFGDEAFSSNDPKHTSILKMLVTEELITVEAKGVDAEAAPNYVHLLMASNDPKVINAAGDDRRFFVLDVGDAHKGDHAYFGAMQAQLDNGGREALLYHLRTLDLSGFNVRLVPKTDALRDQQARSLRGLDAIMFGWLAGGTLPIGEKKPYPKPGRVSRDEPRHLVRLYEKPLRDVVNELLKQRQEKPIGVKDLVEFFRDRLGFRRAESNGGPPYYSLPSLSLCRQHWDAKVSKVNWSQFAAESDDIDVGHEAHVYDLYTENDYAAYGYKSSDDDLAWDDDWGPPPTYESSTAKASDRGNDLTGWRIDGEGTF